MCKGPLFSVNVNDDYGLYVWKDTYNEDTISNFLDRLVFSYTADYLDRDAIHLSYDGVRLEEDTTMQKAGIREGDEFVLHHGTDDELCELCYDPHCHNDPAPTPVSTHSPMNWWENPDVIIPFFHFFG